MTDGGQEIAVDRTSVSVFLSHSSSDKPVVRSIGAQLEMLGYRVWLDEAELVLGDRIHQRIEAAAVQADYLILFLSPESVRSRWVDEEWRLKFEQQLEERSTRVIPVLLEDCEVPPSLKGRLMLRCESRFELLRRGFLEIDAAICSHVSRTSTQAPVQSRNMRNELSKAAKVAADLGTPSNLARLHEVLMAHFRTAASTYDSGQRAKGANVYRQIILDLGDPTFLWSRFRSLNIRGEAFLREAKSALAIHNVVDGVWALRMALDQLMDFVFAARLLSDIVVYLPQHVDDLSNPSWPMDTWAPFDPLRHALQQYKHESFNSFQLLCATCEAAIELVIGPLTEAVSRSARMDIYDATVLRMLRWPGSDGPWAGGFYVEEDTLVQNPAQVLNDVYGFNMLNGGRGRGTQPSLLGLTWDQAHDLIRRVGPVAAFDHALTGRGYPRDDDYWEDPDGLGDGS